MNFTNLRTDKALNTWIKQSTFECKLNYPLPQRLGHPRVPVAVDIGANVGGFCVNAHTWFDKIYAFEPMLENFAILERVLEQLEIDNVEAYNTAVSGRSNEKLGLRIHASEHTGDITCAAFESEEFFDIGQTAETISLSDMMETLRLSKIDYLKVDCEGGEYEILENFSDYEKIDFIGMEIHGFYGPSRKKSLLDALAVHFHFGDMYQARCLSLVNLTPEATITTEEAYQKDNLFLVNKGLKGNV